GSQHDDPRRRDRNGARRRRPAGCAAPRPVQHVQARARRHRGRGARLRAAGPLARRRPGLPHGRRRNAGPGGAVAAHRRKPARAARVAARVARRLRGPGRLRPAVL
ncbi:MAG: hypothetical protein AVDCRST_MAG08-1376, partial [uncultured Acetobacteraceae bacterium]